MEQQFNSKVLLFGEYAVLHHSMALVIPWGKYNGHFDFYEGEANNEFAAQSNQYLKKFCEFAVAHMDDDFLLEVKRFEQELDEGLFFRSNIPQGYGLGSSGALVAAIVLRYLKKAKDIKDELKLLTFQKLSELKAELGKLESYFHGVSSGLDPLSIMLNEPLLVKKSKEIVSTKLPTPSKEKNNTIFLLNTHKERVTSDMMEKFNSLHKQPDFKQRFKDDVVENTNAAIKSLLDYDTKTFYQSVYGISAFQYEKMKAFIPEKLQEYMALGLDNGDYLLKICGAGGGGFMLGFTENWHSTQEALKEYNVEEIYSF